MDDVKIWEIENMHNIIGWEKCNAEQVKKGVWEYFDGFSIIIFNMKDKSQVSFKIYNYGRQ